MPTDLGRKTKLPHKTDTNLWVRLTQISNSLGQEANTNFNCDVMAWPQHGLFLQVTFRMRVHDEIRLVLQQQTIKKNFFEMFTVRVYLLIISEE